jgi:thiol-disulfide isomerase/thioredoxin
MTFASREICAVLLKKPSPVFSRPQTLGIFAICFVLVFFAPLDAVFRLLEFVHFPLSLAQAYNVFRYYRLILRSANAYQYRVTIAVVLSSADQIIEIIARRLFRFTPTRLSSIYTLGATVGLCLLHFNATHRDPSRPYWTGGFEDRLTALVLGFVLGVFYSAVIIYRPPELPEKRPQSPAEEQPAADSNLREFDGGFPELIAEVENHKGLVVVAFVAPESAACDELTEAIGPIAAKYPTVLFLKVNVDGNEELVNQFEIGVLPHLEFFSSRDGEPNKLWTERGFNHAQLTETIDNLLE